MEWLIKVEEKENGVIKFYEEDYDDNGKRKWKAWKEWDFNQFKKWINSLKASIYLYEFVKK